MPTKVTWTCLSLTQKIEQRKSRTIATASKVSEEIVWGLKSSRLATWQLYEDNSNNLHLPMPLKAETRQRLNSQSCIRVVRTETCFQSKQRHIHSMIQKAERLTVSELHWSHLHCQCQLIREWSMGPSNSIIMQQGPSNSKPSMRPPSLEQAWEQPTPMINGAIEFHHHATGTIELKTSN